MEQMSRIHGTKFWKQFSCFAMRLCRLDAREDWEIVRRFRTQASTHNLQHVIDVRVNEVGVSTAAPGRNAVLC